MRATRILRTRVTHLLASSKNTTSAPFASHLESATSRKRKPGVTREKEVLFPAGLGVVDKHENQEEQEIKESLHDENLSSSSPYQQSADLNHIPAGPRRVIQVHGQSSEVFKQSATASHRRSRKSEVDYSYASDESSTSDGINPSKLKPGSVAASMSATAKYRQLRNRNNKAKAQDGVKVSSTNPSSVRIPINKGAVEKYEAQKIMISKEKVAPSPKPLTKSPNLEEETTNNKSNFSSVLFVSSGAIITGGVGYYLIFGDQASLF